MKLFLLLSLLSLLMIWLPDVRFGEGIKRCLGD
jgi:hypothetical protein